MSESNLFAKLVPQVQTDHEGVTLGDIIVIVLDVALLVYTGYRSWHFLESSMPDEYKILALAGLWGLDIGAVAWSLVWIFGSTTRYQDRASLTMFVIDLVGMFLTSLVDSLTFTRNGGSTNVPALLALAALYGVPSIVLLNVVVGFIYHMTSPSTRRKRTERQMQEDLQQDRERADLELRRKQMQIEQSAALLKKREELIRLEQELAQQKIQLDGIEKGLAQALDDSSHVNDIAARIREGVKRHLDKVSANGHGPAASNGQTATKALEVETVPFVDDGGDSNTPAGGSVPSAKGSLKRGTRSE